MANSSCDSLLPRKENIRLTNFIVVDVKDNAFVAADPKNHENASGFIAVVKSSANFKPFFI